MDYKNAGVDIEAGYERVRGTDEEVCKGNHASGGIRWTWRIFRCFFAGCDQEYGRAGSFLSGTDGCGTKVKLAFLMDKHDTIGIDAVAMCVNDVACAGGEPLFFLDYIAWEKLSGENCNDRKRCGRGL